MKFFTYKAKIYPVLAMFVGVFILIFGLITAKSVTCSYFLLGVYVWFAMFGYQRACVRTLPAFIVLGGAFFGISYGASGGNFMGALAMVNRIGAVFLAIIPGMSYEPVEVTRSFSQLHAPRAVTLGVLITMSFVPLLKSEVRRVREAMKTRGAGSILKPAVFYRAFLVPLVMRLTGISDTLALSVETRGYALGKTRYSVYKGDCITYADVSFLLGLAAGAILAVIA